MEFVGISWVLSDDVSGHINLPEEAVMRAHARSCSVEAVIEPFLKANLSLALLGRSSAELLTDWTEGSVSPRHVQDPLRL
jgi:hypothetical protein